MKRNHDIITLELELIHETELAYLLSDGTRKEWVPKVACELEEGKGTTCSVQMSEKLAIEKGFV